MTANPIQSALAARDVDAGDAWAELLDVLQGSSQPTAGETVQLLRRLDLPDNVALEMASAVEQARAIQAAGGDGTTAMVECNHATVALLAWEVETELKVQQLRASRAVEAAAREQQLIDAERQHSRAVHLDQAADALKKRFPFVFLPDVFPAPFTPAGRSWYAAEARRVEPLAIGYDGPPRQIDTPPGLGKQFYVTAVQNTASAPSRRGPVTSPRRSNNYEPENGARMERRLRHVEESRRNRRPIPPGPAI
ncbi:MAG: hypothetical protein QM754_12035 [Tepidisphaeraceae bacterium]